MESPGHMLKLMCTLILWEANGGGLNRPTLGVRNSLDLLELRGL